MTSNSWGHAVRTLTADELARLERQNERGAEIFGRDDYDYDIRCKTPKCRERVTHATQYSYVTGRAGRVSWSERRVCTGHAERFAAKHGIEITGAAPREHALAEIAKTLPGQED